MRNIVGKTGREMVINSRKRIGRNRIILGIVLFLVFVCAALFIGADNNDMVGEMFFCAFSLVGIGCIVNGIMILSNPTNGKPFKKYSNYLEMADSHFSQIWYEDKAIIISRNYISSKKNLMTITPLDEVFLIYIRKTTTYGIQSGKDIIYECARGQFIVPIYGKKSAEVDTIFQNSGYACKNARIGYSADNLTYLKQVKTIWNQKHGI